MSIMVGSVVSRRFFSNYFKLFPKTFPVQRSGGSWVFDEKMLRKEYRGLQAKHHPDVSQDVDYSSLLNKAYDTLKSPLLRSQYMLNVFHKVDLNDEGVANNYLSNDSGILLQILEIHEQLEECADGGDVSAIEGQNKQRITDIEGQLDKLYASLKDDTAGPSDPIVTDIAKKTVELKYWVNLAKAIKEWEPESDLTINH